MSVYRNIDTNESHKLIETYRCNAQPKGNLMSNNNVYYVCFYNTNSNTPYVPSVRIFDEEQGANEYLKETTEAFMRLRKVEAKEIEKENIFTQVGTVLPSKEKIKVIQVDDIIIFQSCGLLWKDGPTMGEPESVRIKLRDQED